MANIKVNELNATNSAEIVDLKAEAEKGNSEAIAAFKSLRGGFRENNKNTWGSGG